MAQHSVEGQMEDFTTISLDPCRRGKVYIEV